MKKYLRVIDANFNRSREGLRVVEDIARFVLDDTALTKSLKKIRHALARSVSNPQALIASRESESDVGRGFSKLESYRKDLRELTLFNFRRVGESLRVLEEISKVSSKKEAMAYKRFRFNVYVLEKKVIGKIEKLGRN